MDSLTTGASCFPNKNTIFLWLGPSVTIEPELTAPRLIHEEDPWPLLRAKSKAQNRSAALEPHSAIRGDKKQCRNSSHVITPTVQQINVCWEKLEQHLHTVKPEA